LSLSHCFSFFFIAPATHTMSQSSAAGDPRVRALVGASSAAVMATHVDPRDDMRAERARRTFDPDAVTLLLHGGDADKVKRT